MAGLIGFTRAQFNALDSLLTHILERIRTLEGSADDGTMRGYVNDWLELHPEATTTVEDGSVTAQKLNVTVTYTVTGNDLTISLT